MALHSTHASAKQGTAHSGRMAQSGAMRDSIHAATPRNSTPKTFLTVSIQAPALGSSFPAEAPTNNKGVPMPRLMANSAAPPRAISPVWLMTVSAAINGGATQAETISADNAPITATPAYVPACCLLLVSLSRVWMKFGISMVNRPNIDDASTTNSRLNRIRIHGWLNVALRLKPLPMAPAAMPAAVYVMAMPST